MTNRTPEPGVQTEGTSLPPPRPFGDAGTLTLARRRRHAAAQGDVVGLTAADAGEAALRAGIMRVEAKAQTVTF